MIPYLHNAIFKVNNFLESLPSFWIMRSQRSRRRDKGLWAAFRCQQVSLAARGRHWQLYGARTRVRRPASQTRLDEYRLGSVDERVGIIISAPIKRMTRRDAGKVHLFLALQRKQVDLIRSRPTQRQTAPKHNSSS